MHANDQSDVASSLDSSSLVSYIVLWYTEFWMYATAVYYVPESVV